MAPPAPSTPSGAPEGIGPSPTIPTPPDTVDAADALDVADAAGRPPTGRPAIGGTFVVSRLAVVAVGAYVGAQVVSDVASVKVGEAFGRAVDMGTFIYPVTFTLRDIVHKALGRRAARTLVVTAAAINLLMAAYLQWAARVPADESYPLAGEFEAVLGPLWRIVVASIVAEVVSGLIDTEAYHWFVRRVTTRYQWARVAVSNAVSVPVDNVLFAVLAFGALPGLADHDLTLPWGAVWDVFLVNLMLKAAVSALSLPLIYLTPDRNWSSTPDDA